MRAAKKLYFVGQLFDLGKRRSGRAVTRTVEAGSAKRPKSGCASSDGSCSTWRRCLWRSSLREGDGDAAVGDIARGVHELALGEHGKQVVQLGFGVEIERRRRAPEPPRTTLANSEEPNAVRFAAASASVASGSPDALRLALEQRAAGTG